MVSLVQNKELTPNIVEKLFREACQALSEPSLSRDTSSFKVRFGTYKLKKLNMILFDFR